MSAGGAVLPSQEIVSAEGERAFDPQNLVDNVELSKINRLGIAAEDYRGLLRSQPEVLIDSNKDSQGEAFGDSETTNKENQRRSQLAVTFRNQATSDHGPDAVITTPHGDIVIREDDMPPPSRDATRSPSTKIYVLEAKVVPSQSLIP